MLLVASLQVMCKASPSVYAFTLENLLSELSVNNKANKANQKEANDSR
jgi:hypothetical protein